MATNPLITDPHLLTVLAAATRVRDQSLSMLDSTTSTTSSELSSQQQKILTAHLARLRGLNRQAYQRIKRTKAETADERREIDGLHLSLQNLYYEQRHLRGEIGGCEDYEHRYRTLPMIPAEEFLAAHPELDGGEVDVTVARIEDEYRARLELEEQRLRLVKRKEELVRETVGKREELGRLDGEFEKWMGGQSGVRRLLEAHERKVGEVGGTER